MEIRESFFALIILWCLGSVLFSIVESIPLIDSLYYSNQIVTSIGAGDIVPMTKLGKISTTLYAFLCMGLYSDFVSGVSGSSFMKNHLFSHLLVSLGLGFFLFNTIESWNMEVFLDTYFMTSTTIGIGNMPKSDVGKIVYSLYTLYSIPVIACAINSFKQVIVDLFTFKPLMPTLSTRKSDNVKTSVKRRVDDSLSANFNTDTPGTKVESENALRRSKREKTPKKML